MQHESSANILIDLLKILRSGHASSQEAIAQSLSEQGHVVNQTKISRLLHKLGAIKTKNVQGDTVYCLPKEPAPPTADSQLASLVIDITYNEQCLFIHTNPGSASLIARLIDHQRDNLNIMGTVAGDDSIIIIPNSCKNIPSIYRALQQLIWVG